MNIQLEYSPAEGKFRQTQPLERKEKVKDYESICSCIDKERAARFIRAMLLKYPELEDLSNRACPAFTTMKEELEQFVFEDIQLQEQQMNSTYQRRVELLTKK